jgi:RimJ/RimL family protein N-acetyltransferase
MHKNQSAENITAWYIVSLVGGVLQARAARTVRSGDDLAVSLLLACARIAIVFAAILVRMALFSEARFQFQAKDDKHLFGNTSLAKLEEPFGQHTTTGDLLARMEQDVFLAGNAYIWAPPGEDRFVRLEPFTEGLRETVKAALDCDPAAWEIMVAPACGAHFDGWWAAALKAMGAGTRIAYAVRRLSDGAVVGTTSLYEIHPAYRRCEIGSTFYRPEARGGPVNPACKRLLLGHAFEAGAVRVEVLTDALNAASAAAIRKLGARDEGVLRGLDTLDGLLRDAAGAAE